MTVSRKDLQDLLTKRKTLREESRTMLDAAIKTGEVINADDEARYNKMTDDIDGFTDLIAKQEDERTRERQIAEERAIDPEKHGDSRDDAQTTEEVRTAHIEAAARDFLRGGLGAVSQEHAEEFRALQAGSDTEGGYLVMPEEFKNQLIKFVDNAVHVRGLATVHRVAKATSLGAPSLDTDVSDADWTVELETGSEDSDMAFGKRVLHPHPVAKRIKISNQLIRQSVMPVERLVLDRLGYKNAVTQEKAFLTGNGSQQPLGVFTANAQGISTSRDVSTDNTTTAITFDGLKNTKYSLKGAYQNAAGTSWMFHRDAVKMIAKLKDGSGRYLWEDSVKIGDPDILLGIRALQSEYAPNTFTTGLYVGMLGDWSNYWIADAMDLQIQRLAELYAETNQIGFISRASVDGMPVLEEAFARVTLA